MTHPATRRRRVARRLASGAAVALLVALLAAGCGGPDGEDGRLGAPADESGSPAPTKVLVVVEENHTDVQVRDGMPYLAGLADDYGYATHWRAITHPSLPNYLAMVGGSTFGIDDDEPPADHVDEVGDALSVFDQALATGRTARTYADSMPRRCDRDDAADPASGVATYAVRHNPWAYFPAGREACLRHDVGIEQLALDAAAGDLPDIGLVVPDVTHDAHDGSLAEADAWLEAQLAPVLAGDDFRSGRLVVVVTADEDDGSGDNTVFTAVITPAVRGVVVDVPLTHYSLTRYAADVLGVEPLGEGATAPDLAAAFGLG